MLCCCVAWCWVVFCIVCCIVQCGGWCCVLHSVFSIAFLWWCCIVCWVVFCVGVCVGLHHVFVVCCVLYGVHYFVVVVGCVLCDV